MYHKEITKDLTLAMMPSICIYVIDETLFALLSVYISTQLGEFLNRVIYMDFAGVTKNLWTIVLCIFVGVVVNPATGFLGETVMFRNCLVHDRIIIRRFLRKTYGNAMKIEESEVQYRLEDDAIELRFNYQEIIVKCAVIICGGTFLLYKALPMNVFYTLIVFGMSILRLVTPLLVRTVKARFDFENREYKTKVRICESMFLKHTWMAKMYGLTEGLLERLQALFETNYKDVESKKISFDSITDSVSDLVSKLSYVIIVFSGACLVGNGTIQAGIIAAMLGYLAVFDIIVADSKIIIETVPILKNLIERMTVLYEGEESTEGESLDEPILKIETKDFRYRYEEEIKADGKEISYSDISADTSKAYFLKGANGCGKSTLLKVLCGYYTGYSGSIRVNGRELRKLNLPKLRQQIAYLEQEPYLFEGTVRENIHLGNLSATDKQVEDSAREMGVFHLLDETVGVDNTCLSGGELQKIALARLFLKEASLMLLDEPEHYLDKEGKQILEKKMNNSQTLILCVRHQREEYNYF